MSKKKPPPRPGLEERLEIRLSSAEKAAFQEAADRQGIGVSQWMRLAGRLVVEQHEGKVKLPA